MVIVKALDAQFAIHQATANDVLAIAGGGLDGQAHGPVLKFFRGGGGHFDAALVGDDTGIHQVDCLFADMGEGALEGCHAQWLDVVGGKFAAGANFDATQRFVDGLGNRVAQFLSDGEVAVDGGVDLQLDVDGVGDGAVGEIGVKGGGDVAGHLDLSFGGAGAKVRGE